LRQNSIFEVELEGDDPEVAASGSQEEGRVGVVGVRGTWE
jgi:hypothetical protein